MEEETGWRPRGIEFVMSSQPVIGHADYPQDLYLAHRAEHVGEPEVDETAEVRRVPVDETPAMVVKGGILCAITIIGRAARPAAVGSRSRTSAVKTNNVNQLRRPP